MKRLCVNDHSELEGLTDVIVKNPILIGLRKHDSLIREAGFEEGGRCN